MSADLEPCPRPITAWAHGASRLPGQASSTAVVDRKPGSPARETRVTITAVAPPPSCASRPSARRPLRHPSSATLLLALSTLVMVAACQGSIVSETPDAGPGGSGGATGSDASTNSDASTGSDSSTETTAKCGPTPTSLISSKGLFSLASGGLSAAMDLAVNATDLYVAVNSNPNATIVRVPLGGGSISTVAAVEGNEQALVLTSDYVVFAKSHTASNNGWAGEIVRVGLDGTDRTVLFSGSISPSSIFGPAGTLATDGKNAYFAAQDGVRSIPLTGGAATVLTTHTGAMALVGSNVVVADSTAEGIFSVPAAGGPVTAVTTGLTGNLGPVVACGSAICWASEIEVAPSMAGTETLQELGPSGPPTTLSQGGALYVVYRLVFDGSDFFATTLADASLGTLVKVPAAGGPPTSGAFGSGLAIDADCLYVADTASGVYSVAKAEWSLAPVP
jgi:hypothetical protein